jgi:hypothetical protein
LFAVSEFRVEGSRYKVEGKKKGNIEFFSDRINWMDRI